MSIINRVRALLTGQPAQPAAPNQWPHQAHDPYAEQPWQGPIDQGGYGTPPHGGTPFRQGVPRQRPSGVRGMMNGMRGPGRRGRR